MKKGPTSGEFYILNSLFCILYSKTYAHPARITPSTTLNDLTIPESSPSCAVRTSHPQTYDAARGA